MILLHHLRGRRHHLCFFHEETVVEVGQIERLEKISALPPSIDDLLWEQEEHENKVRKLYDKFKEGAYKELALRAEDICVGPPVVAPNSFRDAYAFRQHVATSRRNRGLGMIPEFDQHPVFYFANHNAVFGPGTVEVMPDHLDRLDYELEVAIVLGKAGRNLRAANADAHIFGYMILNDLSARTLQMDEMKLNLGPAKGKDFANVFGPMLVTPDELEAYKVAAPSGHTGNHYDMKMKAFVNGQLLSEGSLAQMDWTFAEIIERASYGVDLFPTDIIGSGTVGTGCLLELNGTAQLQNPAHEPRWLGDDDVVRLEVEALGVLETHIELNDSDPFSILALKKG